MKSKCGRARLPTLSDLWLVICWLGLCMYNCHNFCLLGGPSGMGGVAWGCGFGGVAYVYPCSGWYPIFKSGADDLGQQAVYLHLSMVPSEGVGALCGVQILVSGRDHGVCLLSLLHVGFCFGGGHTPGPCG